jgi:hypothetical protein
MKVRPILIFIFWAAVISFSAIFYYDDALAYFFGYRNPRFSAHSVWFVVHIVGATCSLFLGPIQFWKTIRTKYVNIIGLQEKSISLAH